MVYYVCTIAKRKNARRHIFAKTDSYNDALHYVSRINPKRYRAVIVCDRWTCSDYIGPDTHTKLYNERERI